MKRLWQSKIFRKNLRKWLCLYVGVMSLSATVITYSKYISSIISTDTARPAKFIVKINYDYESCDASLIAECDYGKHRPTQNLTYDFEVDTKELEVLTKLSLAIYVNEDFRLVSLKEINADGSSVDVALESPNNMYLETFKARYNRQRWTNTIEMTSSRKTLTKYQAVLQYIPKDDSNYKDVNSSITYRPFVVGYSAIQLDK